MAHTVSQDVNDSTWCRCEYDNQKDDIPSMVIAAAVATTTPVPRAPNALSPMALPILPPYLTGSGVGIKGGSVKDTAFVAPEAGVCTSNIESGSPVDEMPVGVTVMVNSLSSMPSPAQADMKPSIRVSMRLQ